MVWFKVYGNKKDQKFISEFGSRAGKMRTVDRSITGGLHNQPKPERTAKRTSTKSLEAGVPFESDK